ncbi:hypothetical protein [Kaistella carnis]|uniref:hypothetical protein n=1 Tax=Kaistella carnis TaxID=1241979 RepID=UPI0028B02088|nr:hypothetical protein [Kaistella carnis]
MSKPENVTLSLKPVESFETYFFSFAFTLGTVGWILGSLILGLFFTAFYFIGTELYKMLHKD